MSSGNHPGIILAAVLLALLCAPSAAAQNVLHALVGDAPRDFLGASVSGTGDVNNDGHPDFVTGAVGEATNGFGAGMVRVYSGQDGTVLFSRYGDTLENHHGTSVDGAGDVDNDGFADFLAGAPLNDANGINAGLVRVYSGQTGAVLYTRLGDAAGDFLGGSLSGAGDVNNDGFDDFVVGAERHDFNGSNSGLVRVYSGRDGSVLYSRYGDAVDDELGGSVSGAGHLNADSHADFLAGSRLDDTGGQDAGMVRAYSGQTGAVLHDLSGYAALDFLGQAVAGTQDVNGDGFADFAAGGQLNDLTGVRSGKARVYSGQSGATLYTVYGQNPTFGIALGGAGDVNLDGIPDLIVGDTQADGQRGLAAVYSGPCAEVETYGSGCLGANDTERPELALAGDCFGTGATVELQITKAYGGGSAFLLAGVGRASVPWTNDCVLLVQSPWVLLPLGVLSDAGPPPNGNGSLTLPIGLNSPLVSGTLNLQAGIVQPGANSFKNLTNGVEVRVP